MEHLRQEADLRRLVRIIFREFQHEFERSAFPWRIVGSEDDGLPEHDVGVHGCAGDAAGGVVLEATEVAEETAAGAGGHDVLFFIED